MFDHRSHQWDEGILMHSEQAIEGVRPSSATVLWLTLVPQWLTCQTDLYSVFVDDVWFPDTLLYIYKEYVCFVSYC